MPSDTESSSDDPTVLLEKVGENLRLSRKGMCYDVIFCINLPLSTYAYAFVTYEYLYSLTMLPYIYMWQSFIINTVTPKSIIKCLETVIADVEDSHVRMICFKHDHLTTIIDGILDEKWNVVDEPSNKQVEKILNLAFEIVIKELCRGCTYYNRWTIPVLASIFDKSKVYYGEDPKSELEPSCSGVRINQIKIFSKLKGFDQLSSYLSSKGGVDEYYFLSLPSLLESLFEAITITNEKEIENVYIISNGIMKQLTDLDEDKLATLPTKQIHQVLNELQRLNKRLTFSNYKETTLLDYYGFCQSVVLKLIRLDSVEHKCFGLKVIEALIRLTHMPRSYTVSGAGCPHVNGTYEIDSSSIEGGCITGRSIVVYKHDVPLGRVLKMHPCLMTEPGETFLSTWWFITEAKGTQPDYYFHKSKLHEQDRPSSNGWTSCGGVADPPPTIEPHQTDLVPIGEERNTLEQQLSKWIVQNKVFDIVTKAQNSFMETPTAIVMFLSKVNAGNDCLGVRSVLDQKSRLLEPIVALLSDDTCSSAQTLSAATSAQSPTAACSSDSFSAIGAAKQRLAIAERWRKSTESALQQYLLASNEVHNARLYLKELEDSKGVINIDSDSDDDQKRNGDKKQSAKRQRR